MKKYLTRSKSKSQHSLPHFHPIVSIITLFVGILGTIFVTHVLAQVATTTIYACVNNSTGILRIVSSTTTCHNNETLLTWNQQGPAGPPGPSGSGGSDPFSLRPFICTSCYLTLFADRFVGKDFSNSEIHNSLFIGANLKGVIFKGSFASGLILTDADLSNADLSSLKFFTFGFNQLGLFIQAQNVNFTNANLSENTFQQALFKGANFQNANLTNTKFIDRVDLTNAQNMSTANLTGVTWSNTTCPDGTNSDNNGNTCVGHF